jgi:hypothetical protein
MLRALKSTKTLRGFMYVDHDRIIMAFADSPFPETDKDPERGIREKIIWGGRNTTVK